VEQAGKRKGFPVDTCRLPAYTQVQNLKSTMYQPKALHAEQKIAPFQPADIFSNNLLHAGNHRHRSFL